jgi:hypothetical protein
MSYKKNIKLNEKKNINVIINTKKDTSFLIKNIETVYCQ